MTELWEDCPLFAPEGTVIPRIPDDETAENVSPAVGALSHVLYDEESPEEVSELLREDGNRLFKQGKRGWKAAIKKYTEAIEVKCDIPEVAAAAFANRAAAELKLGNYRRALDDSEAALSWDPNNIKSRYRAVSASIFLNRFASALAHCDVALETLEKAKPERKADVNLFLNAKRKAQEGLEAEKKREASAKKRQKEKDDEESVRSKIFSDRGISAGFPLFAQQRSYTVTTPTITNSGILWPLLLIYPEQGLGIRDCGDQSDYFEHVDESTRIVDVLATVFPPDSPPAPWDVNRRYTNFEALDVLFREKWTKRLDETDDDDASDYVGSLLGPEEVGAWRAVNVNKTLRQVLESKNYVMPLFPVLYVVPRGQRLSGIAFVIFAGVSEAARQVIGNNAGALISLKRQYEIQGMCLYK